MKQLINFSYKKSKPLFSDFTFEIADKQITFLCGHNGAGKTTLLKLLSGILPSKSKSEDTWYISSTGGLMFHFSLNEHLSLLNVKTTFEDNDLWRLAYTLFEAKNFEDKKISNLSSGQVMMASIIVALASKKSFLLLDEPFAPLDPTNAKHLQTILQELKKKDITVLVTSHDLFMTKETADNVLFLKNGKIVFSKKVDNDLSVDTLFKAYNELC